VTVADLTERQLIQRIADRLQPPPDWLTVGIGDDAAVVEPERNRLEVLSVDAIVEGVHFDRRYTPPDAIGHRALAVNLSDLAAMGASPRLALLSFVLPPELSRDDFDAVVSGLAGLALRHRLHVVGGNLTRSPGPLMIDVTVVGTIKRRQVLRRAGARPGDGVYVSGSVGAAAAGLGMLRRGVGIRPEGRVEPLPGQQSGDRDPCVQRYLYPEPRVRLGLLLGRNRVASACMDLSDGLADGVRQIAEASGVGIIVEAGMVPVDPGARAWFDAHPDGTGDALVKAIAGGDDYELVFTAPRRTAGQLRAAAARADVALTRIGFCTPAPDLILRRLHDGRPIDDTIPPGFKHFG
jgi:thiamine-monophosphate kinase